VNETIIHTKIILNYFTDNDNDIVQIKDIETKIKKNKDIVQIKVSNFSNH